jgi:hypothetical protein
MSPPGAFCDAPVGSLDGGRTYPIRIGAGKTRTLIVTLASEALPIELLPLIGVS